MDKACYGCGGQSGELQLLDHSPVPPARHWWHPGCRKSFEAGMATERARHEKHDPKGGLWDAKAGGETFLDKLGPVTKDIAQAIVADALVNKEMRLRILERIRPYMSRKEYLEELESIEKERR